MATANNLDGTAANEFLIEAIELLIEQNDFTRAARISLSLNSHQLVEPQLIRRNALNQAQIALANNDPESAEQFLTSALDSAAPTPEYLLLLGDVLMTLDRPIEAFQNYTANAAPAGVAAQALHNAAWRALEKIEVEQLSSLAREATSYSKRGWLELAKAVVDQEISIQGQLNAIAQWQRVWSSHEAVQNLPEQLVRLQQDWQRRPRNVAVILPLQEQAGKAIEEGFLSAYYHSLGLGLDAPQIKFYDSSGLSNIYPTYDEAVDAGADLIIGPLKKELVEQLHRLPDLTVPTLALNYIDETDTRRPSLFYQFGLAPENEIQQAAQYAAESGFQNAAVILPNGEDYLRLDNIFENAWNNVGGSIVSRSTFDSDSNYGELVKQAMAIDASEARAEKIEALLPRNEVEFVPRRRQDIDFIYLIANPRQGRQIRPTLAFYFAEDLPVIAYPSIYDGATDPDINRDLDGIVLLDAPWLLESSDPVKKSAKDNLRPTVGPLQRLRALGVDSYRLHDRLSQFTTAQITALKGTTGVLTINENKEVRRQLLTARFVEGIPEMLSQPELSP